MRCRIPNVRQSRSLIGVLDFEGEVSGFKAGNGREAKFPLTGVHARRAELSVDKRQFKGFASRQAEDVLKRKNGQVWQVYECLAGRGTLRDPFEEGDMSLNRLALRIATVLALKGRTHAGDAVFDSRNATIDEISQDQAVPVISVYTDEDIPGDERQVNLVIECAVSVLEQKDGKEPKLWTPTTDPMLELNLDLMEAEIADALAEPGE